MSNNLKPSAAEKPKTMAGEDAAVYVVRGDATVALALMIDETVRRVRPDDWRGHQAREHEIKRALLPLLGDNLNEVERVFLIIEKQKEY
jgi:type I restriction enzyme R subunit